MEAQNHLSSQLRDIKPPVAIDDWSIYLYWGVIITSIIVLLLALYALYRTVKKLHRVNRRKGYLESLKSINWSDPKHSAYEATRLGRLLLGDDERLHELYQQMISELKAYKYKKEVNPLDSNAKAQFDLFVKACDESL
jgi:hypothetical protein